MDQSKPTITSTAHILPFEQLSPLDFERLCLWLVEREGYHRARHLGLGGSEQGREVIAYKATPQGEELWYFQCKKYRSIGAATLKAEVDKCLALAEEEPEAWPTGVVFVVNCAVTARVEKEVATYCLDHRLAYEFWAQTELDTRVKCYPEIIAEFFGAGRPSPPLISPEAIAEHRAALRQRLEAAAREHWDGMSVYIQEGGATLPIEASPYGTGRLGPRQNLLEMAHAADRLLILGEAGSGKTVALPRLAW